MSQACTSVHVVWCKGDDRVFVLKVVPAKWQRVAPHAWTTPRSPIDTGCGSPGSCPRCYPPRSLCPCNTPHTLVIANICTSSTQAYVCSSVASTPWLWPRHSSLDRDTARLATCAGFTVCACMRKLPCERASQITLRAKQPCLQAAVHDRVEADHTGTELH